MRQMAGFAAIHPSGGVLKNEGPAFIGVAFYARFFIAELLFHQLRARGHPPRGRVRSMWIVAIRALHHSFVDAMLERHGKLRAHIAVAGVANIRLLLRQQEFGLRRMMHRVAAGARHTRFRMPRMFDVRFRLILDVATQAGFDHLLRRHFSEHACNRRLSLAFGVLAARAMASFAACVLRRFGATRHRFKVRIPEEGRGNSRVAAFARSRPYKILTGGRRGGSRTCRSLCCRGHHCGDTKHESHRQIQTDPRVLRLTSMCARGVAHKQVAHKDDKSLKHLPAHLPLSPPLVLTTFDRRTQNQ